MIATASTRSTPKPANSSSTAAPPSSSNDNVTTISTIKLRPDFRTYIPNFYELHRRLWMAFPADTKKQNDPNYTKHYQPTDFLPVTFLFRLEKDTVYVQTHNATPDWDYAFKNVQFLVANVHTRPANNRHEPNTQLRFDLHVNPTTRQGLPPEQRTQNGKRAQGKRTAVPKHNLPDWLQNKGNHGGFHVDNLQITHEHDNKMKKYSTNDNITIHSFHCQGLLTVTNTKLFQTTLDHGIGSAKALGQGLLLTAPTQKKLTTNL